MVPAFEGLEPDRPMGGFRKRLHPIQETLQRIRPRLGERVGFHRQRPRQCDQLARRATSGGGRPPRIDLRFVSFEQLAPGRALVMMKAIDGFGVERRKATGDTLPAQVVLTGPGPQIVRHGGVSAVDIQLLAADLVHQLAGVPEADGQEADEINGYSCCQG